MNYIVYYTFVQYSILIIMIKETKMSITLILSGVLDMQICVPIYFKLRNSNKSLPTVCVIRLTFEGKRQSR